MFATPEKLSAAASASVETFLSATSIALASAERLCALNLNTARSTLEEFAANLNTVLAATDAQAITEIAGSMSQGAVEKSAAYARNVYEILRQTQDDLSKTVEAQFVEFNKSASAALDEAAKNAPQGSEVTLSAMKSVLAAASSAYDSVSKATKQAVDMASANVAAATDATVKAVSVPAAMPKGGKKAA